MAYDPKLLERIRAALSHRTDVVEKKMFGGVAFMVRGNMACGPHNNNLIVRIGDAAAADAMKKPFVKPMNFTGKVLKTFAMIEPGGIATKAQLRRWVELAADYAASIPRTKTPKRTSATGRSKPRPKSKRK